MGLGATPPRSGNARVPCVQRCRVGTSRGVYGGVVCNLSVVGAYVTLGPALATGERVSLAFLLPGDPIAFQSAATVTWQNGAEPQKVGSLAPGCGLRFDDLPPPERQRLARVVRDYSAGRAPADGGA
jgi:hypothetical protein